MRSRLAKKVAARFSARALSVPLALAHARPSFWRLDVKTQRHFLKGVLSAPNGPHGLGVASDIAGYVTRRWAPAPENAP